MNDLVNELPVLLYEERITAPPPSEGISASLGSSPEVEISIVVKGNGVHRIMGKDVPCAERDIYVLSPGVPHAYYAQEEGGGLTVLFLRFRPEEILDHKAADMACESYCHGIFSENAMMTYAMLSAGTWKRVDELVCSMRVELLERKPDWKSALAARLTLLLITLTRYVNNSIKTTPRVKLSQWGPVSAAILAINESYSDPDLTLESLAGSFFVSRSKLSRLFLELSGESFSQCLRRVRFTEACKRLAFTELSVEEAARECGFKDMRSFYKGFLSFTGMTPSKYRKQNKFIGGIKMSIINEICENLQKGRSKVVKELVASALENGISAQEILNDGLLAGMNVIGEKFKKNEVYVPEVLVAARAMNFGMQILKPYLSEEGAVAAGKVCIGTVQGDLHDIGKNLVRMMMEGKGLEVVDLGTDVAPETFVKTAKEQGCQVICLSALLTTTMGVMEEVVKEAEKQGIRDKVKIMIGGAPVTDEYCRTIGADCYTLDAASAADAAVLLCKSVQ